MEGRPSNMSLGVGGGRGWVNTKHRAPSMCLWQTQRDVGEEVKMTSYSSGLLPVRICAFRSKFLEFFSPLAYFFIVFNYLSRYVQEIAQTFLKIFYEHST